MVHVVGTSLPVTKKRLFLHYFNKLIAIDASFVIFDFIYTFFTISKLIAVDVSIVIFDFLYSLFLHLMTTNALQHHDSYIYLFVNTYSCFQATSSYILVLELQSQIQFHPCT